MRRPRRQKSSGPRRPRATLADLQYALKQFDWLIANAANYDFVSIGGDLLDLSSHLDFEMQIVMRRCRACKR